MSPNIILATYLTGIFDVNRNEILSNDDIKPIEIWLASIVKNNLHGVLFHNSLSEASTAQYKNNMLFVKVEPSQAYSPNVYRYFLYQSFLKEHQQIKNFFITDCTDVMVLKNPFIESFFIENNSSIFCGDEPKKLHDEWMYKHCELLRGKIYDFKDFEQFYRNDCLLNCGIIGGNRKVMTAFLDKLCTIHKKYNANNPSLYTGDMGAFNYIIRTQFNKQLLHGSPINTIFKLYETQRIDCWFKHK